MGEKYEKNGTLYESGFLGDREIGEIKQSPTGEYVVEKDGLGGKVMDVRRNLFGDKITVDTDYNPLDNTKSGFTIEKTFFGQKSHEWVKSMSGETNAQTKTSSNVGQRSYTSGSLFSRKIQTSKGSKKENPLEVFLVSALGIIGAIIGLYKGVLHAIWVESDVYQESLDRAADLVPFPENLLTVFLNGIWTLFSIFIVPLLGGIVGGLIGACIASFICWLIIPKKRG